MDETLKDLVSVSTIHGHGFSILFYVSHLPLSQKERESFITLCLHPLAHLMFSIGMKNDDNFFLFQIPSLKDEALHCLIISLGECDLTPSCIQMPARMGRSFV